VRKKGTIELGVKTKIKNINSFRFLQKALEYEARGRLDSLKQENPSDRKQDYGMSTKTKLFL